MSVDKRNERNKMQQRKKPHETKKDYKQTKKEEEEEEAKQHERIKTSASPTQLCQGSDQQVTSAGRISEPSQIGQEAANSSGEK